MRSPIWQASPSVTPPPSVSTSWCGSQFIHVMSTWYSRLLYRCQYGRHKTRMHLWFTEKLIDDIYIPATRLCFTYGWKKSECIKISDLAATHLAVEMLSRYLIKNIMSPIMPVSSTSRHDSVMWTWYDKIKILRGLQTFILATRMQKKWFIRKEKLLNVYLW